MSEARVRYRFDRDWQFTRGDAKGAQEPGYDDSAWSALTLPHDWSIEGPFDQNNPSGDGGGYVPCGVGWYRKTFTLAEGERGRRAEILFDGVYRNSDVWLNGHHLGWHPYGYTSFAYDITSYLHDDDSPNVLAVRVDNSGSPIRAGILARVYTDTCG